MKQKLMCAFFVGEAENKEKTREIAESYRNCPYIRIMATKGSQIFATFFLPTKQRWWIEYIEKKPKETFGLEKAEVTFVDDVQYPKQLKMRLPKKPLEISPCGSSCGKCSSYETCLGCPATVFYKHRSVSQKQCSTS